MDLIERGKRDYEWAKQNMPLLNSILNEFSDKQILDKVKIGICLHLTKETAVLILALQKLGAEIFLCSANPLSIQDHVRCFLQNEGINVYAEPSGSINAYYENMNKILEIKPNIITDDGGELHKRALLNNTNIIGGTEETTTGINRIKEWENNGMLSYPIIAVNQTKSKSLFDNRYGTGQSIIDGILRITGLLLASKIVIVCGYGWVGKGVAHYARGMGSKVLITEINPIKALEAFFDGFEVHRLIDISHKADIIITCTGQINVVRQEHFENMKNGVILCNAGHFDVEIDKKYLYSQNIQVTNIREHIKCYINSYNGKKIFLLADGRVVNLIGAEGNSPEVMSFSFANQLLCIIYLSKFHNKLNNKLYNVPSHIEKKVNHVALRSFGLKIDKLTKEQSEYFSK